MENKVKKSENIDLKNVNINVEKIKDKLGKEDKPISSNYGMIYKFERLNLSDREEKALRTKIRNKLQKFYQDICIYKSDKENVKKAISEFLKFYAENWLITDFKIDSFSRSRKNKESYEKMLNIVKDSIS